ncbi:MULTISPECIES: glycosyltransferase family 4 protein [unclassified Empedobacter]|uniref:glycosyltransferase family 4 protein n=1 Tax=unclassified Empedobacter TaxID=2643773 RepID=UPI0025BE5BD6|nr:MULTISPECIES: glycosyltransferase family 4 protein [unclassified Empedobacter]
MELKRKNYIIYHDHFDILAGTERVLINLIEFLTSKKANVTLVLFSEKKDPVFNLEKFNINIINLNVKNNENKFVYYYKLLKSTKKLFSIYNFPKDTVAISTNYLAAYILYLAKPKHLEIVSCEHFSVTVMNKLSLYLRKLFYNKVNVVMLTKEETIIIKEKYNPKNCVCIPNAVPFESEKYNENKTKNILAIGRITSQKGFDLLVEAFSKINNEYPDWTLNIVGDDYGDKDSLDNFIEQHKIKNIKINPSTSNIQEYYRNAAFYVLSSRFEGFGMVLVEAMAHGLPCISFNCKSGPSDIITNNVDGFLIEDFNIYEMAAKIKLLIQDEELRLIMSQNAHQKVKYFHKDVINSKWIVFFNSI